MDPMLFERRRRPVPAADLGPLFDQPPTPAAPSATPAPSASDLARAGVARAAANHADEIRRWAPIARELAQRAGSIGITVSAVVREAKARGVDLGESPDWLGALMKKAGLVASGRVVRSTIPEKHGNRQMVWLHPDHAAGAR